MKLRDLTKYVEENQKEYFVKIVTENKQLMENRKNENNGIVLNSAFDWIFEGKDKEYDEKYKDFI